MTDARTMRGVTSRTRKHASILDEDEPVAPEPTGAAERASREHDRGRTRR